MRGFAFKPAGKSANVGGGAKRRRGYREYIRKDSWQDGSAGRLACCQAWAETTRQKRKPGLQWTSDLHMKPTCTFT